MKKFSPEKRTCKLCGVIYKGYEWQDEIYCGKCLRSEASNSDFGKSILYGESVEFENNLEKELHKACNPRGDINWEEAYWICKKHCKC